MKGNLDSQFWLIELLAWWEGKVNTLPLCEYFAVSRQAASRYLKHYNLEQPGSFTYNNRLKTYLPTQQFRPTRISKDVSEYLNWVTGSSPAKGSFSLPCTALPRPSQLISPNIMQPLIAAVREQRRLDVDYYSVSSASTEGRIITPHTFVNTGLRWHVRAYCERSKEYRDFVLSRFRGTPELQEGKSEHTEQQDTPWNTEVTLVLVPDQRLNPDKRNVIEHDYQMQNGELHIKTRAALVQYTLHSMQVSTKMLDGNPEAQQLVLSNATELKEWLF